MTKLVVKKHQPLRLALLLVVASMTFSLAVCLLLDVSYWKSIENRLRQNQLSYRLLEKNKNLETENKTLQGQVLALQRLSQIDKQSAVKLQDQVKMMQDELYSLRGELEFYEGIMSSSKGSKGLSVQGLQVRLIPDSQMYSVKIVLTNVAESDRVVNATVDVSVEGRQGEESQVLSLDQVTVGKQFNHNIKFKHFKRVEGRLSFPAGFIPLKVAVELKRKGHKGTTIRKIFDWSQILAEMK